MKYTKEEFIKELNKITSDPFEILEFEGISKSGKYYCGLCKKEYTLNKMSYLLKRQKHLCSHCFASQYAEEVKELIEKSEQFEFIQFGYKTNLHKPTVVYFCKLCKEITEKPLVEFKLHSTCIHCGNNAKRRNEQTIKEVLPDGFEVLEEYHNQYEKILFRHSCGFIFKARPKDLISGHSFCPKCSKKASKGERKIMNWLEQEKIFFIKEKIFNWSEQKRYDFYLPKQNLIIEYHGVQHYKEVKEFFLPLEEQQKIDSWKEAQAKENGINYLVISYLDFENIETILAQRLKEST